jgi:hypothetical protein
MNLKESIRRILREEQESKAEALKSMISSLGLYRASKLVGGISNLIKIIYNGDIIEFSKDLMIPLVYISSDGMVMYLHDALVERLGLKDGYRQTSRGTEKELGDFRYGAKDNMPFKFTGYLTPTNISDQSYWRVVGISGSYGFGYSFISRRETLGKRIRQQIFKQIIDKYNLQPYL